MNEVERPFRLAIVAGEESGDLLGSDLISSLRNAIGQPVQLIGIGGAHLQAKGLQSLFDSHDINLMGISAVLRNLPRLVLRIEQTARAIAAAKPDCLVTVDVPDFSLRVAKKVRKLAPDVPIVHYVCPSVWAWRPGRAPAMKPHVDRLLCLLPFEPAELARLGGPEGVYVGHRLVSDPGVLSAAAMQARPRDMSPDREKTLLILPGSRRSEVASLVGTFRETIDLLVERGHRLRLLMPTVPRVESALRAAVAGWTQQPEIIVSPERKWQAFGEADAALIASGTVSLELALAGVPMVSCYKLDPLMRFAQSLITVWAASLPNIIADRPIVFESYDLALRPPTLARIVESLFADTAMRRWQKEGFEEVRRRMATPRPAGDIAADAVLDVVAARKPT
ncbi:MAG: lipid-A-disaccharide synthase [Rhizobiaceae bacterium]|nr:MAG: lipid-A-disaccharide synthase [Rhizobiaceae bacterium]CAG1011230.1 lipid-A-disaccharide synthase [Rhizobiaceae bacterium]